jgi:hypothetical protein
VLLVTSSLFYLTSRAHSLTPSFFFYRNSTVVVFVLTTP